MSLRKLCQGFPTIFRHLKTNTSLKTTQNIVFKQLGCCSSVHQIQVRNFYKDASKYEIPDDGRVRVYYGVLTPQIRTVKVKNLRLNSF